jgi:serine phosphatase RsbU (regulator of sigma subunit)
MAASYVAVTLVIVLLLEALVVGLGLYLVAASPLSGYWALNTARNTAQLFALQAAVYAGDAGLNPQTTFAPGQPASLTAGAEVISEDEAWFRWPIPYVPPGSGAPGQVPVALLIGPNEQIIASSYPDQFPPASDAAALVPDDLAVIRAALAGQPDGALRETPNLTLAAVAATVWSQDRQPLGAVYLLTPAGGPPGASLLPALAAILIPSGLAWLCLMLPIGLVFGVLTTRGLIRRIERLAEATARFKEGDPAIRVPVGRADEIGQLERQFNAMAEQLLDSFAQRQALAEQSARREERARLDQELSSAHYIQQSLLPEAVPALPGWALQRLYQPAREVGGDLYDFLPLPDGRLGLVIGDASGKGVPSALIMATTCAMLRAAAPGSPSPGQVLARVNDLLHRYMPRATFATCFYAILDPAGGRLRFANAGHNLPYLCRSGEVLELRATGMPLGLMPEQDYEECEARLAAGDCALFYTDGLVEAHDAERRMFGAERVRQQLLARAPADGLIESLYADLLDFTGAGWEQEDDVTLLVLRRAPAP